VTRRSTRTRLAVTAGRLAGWASRTAGRGAGLVVSGRVTNALAPRALAELAAPQRVVLVSATNGKTTTTRLLVAALEAAGHAVVTNPSGANLASGLVTALASTDEPGFAVLEVDEFVLPSLFDALGPELLVWGNLTRDQLDRMGEVRAITDRWRRTAASSPELRIVANASDPQVAWAAAPAATTWVRAGASWRDDSASCPQCGALLTWPDGGFACPRCRFTAPAAAYALDGDEVVDVAHGSVRVKLALALPGRWNLVNATLAIAAAAQLGVNAADAADAMSEVTTVSGRYTRFHLPDGRPARLLLAKNPAGWHEVLGYLADRDSGVVIAVNSRLADGRDPSWLWDVPYEKLAGRPLAAAGERALDVAVRLRYADAPAVVEPDPMRAALLTGGDEVDVVASYTVFARLAGSELATRKDARP